MSTTTDLDRARLADGLKDAARLLREHPDLPEPYVTSRRGRRGGANIAWYLHHEDDLTPDEQANLFLRISARLGSRWEPGYTPAGCKGWEANYGDHLRLIVTYRLSERVS